MHRLPARSGTTSPSLSMESTASNTRHLVNAFEKQVAVPSMTSLCLGCFREKAQEIDVGLWTGGEKEARSSSTGLCVPDRNAINSS
jgi:hypothetical protein